ncbi:MAG TPA: tryptophan synthase subunit alpha [Mariprofundaceae bacterium]|nr:tryptophan synthase subunit alpha [Mariprofundaceae bacterium]
MSDDRLSACFARCRDESRAALVGYLTAGDPDPAVSEKLLHALAGQVDVLEIGMPFSDPMADGPVIQAASERALAAGTRMNDVFRLAASVRAGYADIGIVLMGYANVVYAMGYTRFAERAAQAGVDGVLLVDIPPEEAGELDAALKAEGICSIRLLAPTSSPERRQLAAQSAGGFIYYVSLTGITGAQMGDMGEVQAQVSEIRKLTPLPICVGFGVKTPEQVRQVAAFADGVVVGSHFVTQITEHLADRSMMINAVAQAASRMHSALEKGGSD